MTTPLAEYARQSRIPAKVLHYLKRQGFIADPLDDQDLLGLALLERVWGKREVLRPQLAKLSRSDRQRFLETADLPSKWERYAYSRFRNQAPGKKLPMRVVIEEIEITFGFRPEPDAITRLHRARNRAQVARHREKTLTAGEGETSYRARTKK